MKIKNTSEKIISIGTTVLMPGDEITTNTNMVNTPAIVALVKRGTLSVDDSEEKIQAAADAAAKKAAAEAKAEAEQKAKEEAEQKAAADAAAKKAASEKKDSKGKSAE